VALDQPHHIRDTGTVWDTPVQLEKAPTPSQAGAVVPTKFAFFDFSPIRLNNSKEMEL